MCLRRNPFCRFLCNMPSPHAPPKVGKVADNVLRVLCRKCNKIIHKQEVFIGNGVHKHNQKNVKHCGIIIRI